MTAEPRLTQRLGLGAWRDANVCEGMTYGVGNQQRIVVKCLRTEGEEKTKPDERGRLKFN